MQNGHKSCVLWFTGLSGSGKSTLAYATEKKLFDLGFCTYVLDGDNIRHGLTKDLGFHPDDRKENIRRIAEAAKLFADAGVITIVSAISPYREDREKTRALFEPDEFIEVYIQCALDECERRDPKGMYKRARSGELKHFTGISAPYEPPERPELRIDTEKQTIEQSVDQVMQYLLVRDYLGYGCNRH